MMILDTFDCRVVMSCYVTWCNKIHSDFNCFLVVITQWVGWFRFFLKLYLISRCLVFVVGLKVVECVESYCLLLEETV